MTNTTTTESAPRIPPIPTVPLVDADKRCTREWWLWFQLVFQVALEQQGLLSLGAVFDLPGDVVMVPIDVSAAVAGILPDAPADPGALLLAALPPADPVSPDQIALTAVSMRLLA
jgi:hypothetical protein